MFEEEFIMRTKEFILMTLLVVSIIPKLHTVASEEEVTSYLLSSEDFIISWSTSGSRLIPLNFSLPSGNYLVTLFCSSFGSSTSNSGYELLLKENDSSSSSSSYSSILFILPRDQQNGLEYQKTSQIILLEENSLYLEISWEIYFPFSSGKLIISSESFLKKLSSPSTPQFSPSEVLLQDDTGIGQMTIIFPIEPGFKGLVHTLNFEIEVDTSLCSYINWVKLDFLHLNQLQYSVDFNSGGSFKFSFNFVSEFLVPLLVIDFSSQMEGQVRFNLVELYIDNHKNAKSNSDNFSFNLSEDPALTLLLLNFLVFGALFSLKTAFSIKLGILRPKTAPSSKYYNSNYIITQNSEPLTFSLDNISEVNSDE